ncbi:hypothetical protein [Agrobacterium sp. P15N1-A]|uniref:hypothetical protein n=1 Tax=Agrobacterium sp. P15N1-A TaxID=3342820 RepID=UPI0037CCD2C2
MNIFRKVRLVLPMLPLVLLPTFAHAGDWEYYEDGYGGSYYAESYNDRFHSSGDIGAAVALGMVGGIALGATAAKLHPFWPAIGHGAMFGTTIVVSMSGNGFAFAINRYSHPPPIWMVVKPVRAKDDFSRGALMLHHIEIYVSNLDASHVFWSTLLAKLGYVESSRWSEGFTLANEHDAYLTFVQVAEKHAFRQYHRCGIGLNHIAFRVKGKEVVDSIRHYCLESGIASLYDEKYPFANGGTDYYALFIEDPDRIKVEFVAV